MPCLDGCVYGLHEYSQSVYWIGPTTTTMGIFIGIGSTLTNVGLYNECICVYFYICIIVFIFNDDAIDGYIHRYWEHPGQYCLVDVNKLEMNKDNQKRLYGDNDS